MKKGFWNVVKEIIRKSDIVLEVLDARFPELTRIRKLEDYAFFFKKPVLKVINKADIVSAKTLMKIREQYQDSVIVSTKLSKGTKGLINKIHYLSKMKNPRVAVIGYPNTGKSSLINRLSKGGKTKTSSESGYTKGLQLITGKNDIMLFDTPGVVPFKERDETRLGLVSGISPSKLQDPDIVALNLIKIFMRINPFALQTAYDIKTAIPENFLIEFGKKNNMLIKGGSVDERRAAIRILTDWHKGKIKL